MSELRVGIVDSGYHPRQQRWVEAAAAFVWYPDGLYEEAGGQDQLGHGSRVVEIITRLAPQVRLRVAQVFQARPTTSVQQVVAAIDWLVAQQVQVINLSLGMRSASPELERACAQAVAAGVLLCAASPASSTGLVGSAGSAGSLVGSASRAAVYPAALPGVLRITGDARCAPHEIAFLDLPHADFGAHVRPWGQAAQSAAWEGSGASMACAYLTGHLLASLDTLEKGASRQRAVVMDHLQRRATYLGPEQRRSV